MPEQRPAVPETLGAVVEHVVLERGANGRRGSSGRNDKRSSWSVNEYISFSTMSVASPTARTNRSVFSTMGVRMLRYPYCSNTSRAVSSKTCHSAASSGRTSFMPRTAWIVPAIVY